MFEQFIVGWILQDISQEKQNYIKIDRSGYYQWLRCVDDWINADMFFTRKDLINKLKEIESKRKFLQKSQDLIESRSAVLVAIPVLTTDRTVEPDQKTLDIGILLGRSDRLVFDLLWKQSEQSGIEYLEKQQRSNKKQ